METRSEMTVPITQWNLRHVRYSLSHLCDGSAGKPEPLFGFVVRGEARLKHEEGETALKEGDFFFLPDRERYRTFWSGDPFVEYYILSFAAAPSVPRFAPARIRELGGEGTLAALRQMEGAASGGLKDQAEAAAIFFRLYSEALAQLGEGTRRAQSQSVLTAREFIRAHASESCSVSEIARAACLSESRLYHLFREETGTTPLAYKNEVRVERAAALLREGATIWQAALACGFGSEIYFRRVFKQLMGVTPGAYRRRCAPGN